MGSLIVVDAQLHENTPGLGPVVELVLKEDVLGRIMEWSTRCEDQLAVPLRLELLEFYELMFSGTEFKLWCNGDLLKPLLDLVNLCKQSTNKDVERKVVALLNQLCSFLMENVELMNGFLRFVD
jgi:hypothetical protein